MKILLACDPRSENENLIQHVTSRAWPSTVEFDILGVVEPLLAELLPETVPDLIARATKFAEDKVSIVAECLRANGLSALGYVVEGDPHDAIVERAATLGVDLILLGAPDHDAVLPFMNGRVVRAVLRHASCSVGILRGPAVRRVLVATDGSDFSLAAAREIAARPWNEETEFEVVAAVVPESASLRYLAPAYVNSEQVEEMRATAMRHAEDAIAKVETILSAAELKVCDNVLVPVESPQKLILDEAVRWGADLIVLGSHGRRGLKRFLIGSVSESVAMHAGCSVEVVR